MSCNNFYDIMKNLFLMPQERVLRSRNPSSLHYYFNDPMIIDKPQKGKSCLAVITTWRAEKY